MDICLWVGKHLAFLGGKRHVTEDCEVVVDLMVCQGADLDSLGWEC